MPLEQRILRALVAEVVRAVPTNVGIPAPKTEAARTLRQLAGDGLVTPGGHRPVVWAATTAANGAWSGS